jgi:hypothetical protein
MNREIKARDLIAAGWHDGRRLGDALRRARNLSVLQFSKSQRFVF